MIYRLPLSNYNGVCCINSLIIIVQYRRLDLHFKFGQNCIIYVSKNALVKDIYSPNLWFKHLFGQNYCFSSWDEGGLRCMKNTRSTTIQMYIISVYATKIYKTSRALYNQQYINSRINKLAIIF